MHLGGAAGGGANLQQPAATGARLRMAKSTRVVGVRGQGSYMSGDVLVG